LVCCIGNCKKEDVKTSLAAMKDGGHGVIAVPHIVIFSTGRGKC